MKREDSTSVPAKTKQTVEGTKTVKRLGTVKSTENFQPVSENKKDTKGSKHESTIRSGKCKAKKENTHPKVSRENPAVSTAKIQRPAQETLTNTAEIHNGRPPAELIRFFKKRTMTYSAVKSDKSLPITKAETK